MVNFANDYNIRNGFISVSVYLKGKELTMTDLDKSNEAELIEKYLQDEQWIFVEGSNKEKIRMYTCELVYDETTGQVIEVYCDDAK